MLIVNVQNILCIYDYVHSRIYLFSRCFLHFPLHSWHSVLFVGYLYTAIQETCFAFNHTVPDCPAGIYFNPWVWEWELWAKSEAGHVWRLNCSMHYWFWSNQSQQICHAPGYAVLHTGHAWSINFMDPGTTPWRQGCWCSTTISTQLWPLSAVKSKFLAFSFVSLSQSGHSQLYKRCYSSTWLERSLSLYWLQTECVLASDWVCNGLRLSL